MNIVFEVGTSQAQFHRSSITGRASVVIDDQQYTLADPTDPSTHFSTRLTRRWRVDHQGHRVEITKTRPLWFAAFRPNAYTVTVDGHIAATAEGR